MPLTRSRGRARRRETWVAFAFLSPAIAGFLVFVLGPALAAVALSFYDYDVLTAPRWVGLANYAQFFRDSRLPRIYLNTLVYVVWYVGATTVLGVALAVAVRVSLISIQDEPAVVGGVRDAVVVDVGVAEVAQRVPVLVLLARVVERGAVVRDVGHPVVVPVRVAEVAQTVPVLVVLERVVDGRTVVPRVAHAVAVVVPVAGIAQGVAVEVRLHETPRSEPHQRPCLRIGAQELLGSGVRDAESGQQGSDRLATKDAGLAEVKSVAEIPVLGLGETTLFHACTLGRKLGLITINPVFIPWHEDQVIRYGLQQRVVGVRAVEATVADFINAFASKEGLEKLKPLWESECRRLLEAGADVIVPAGGLPMMLFSGEFEGAPVVNGVTLIAKTAEMAIKLRKLDSKQMQFEGGYVLEGTPKEATPAYQKILLYVDGGTYQVRRVLLLDAQGNRNRFDFVTPAVNEKIPAGEFNFKPPPGTQTIKP